jgi:SAM-dependent methyltransferase
MHATSMENMQKCYDRYIRNTDLALRGGSVVLDVGGTDVNGSYRSIFKDTAFEYLGCDISPGPGVSIVQLDPHHIPLDDASVDIVLCGQMLEHCEFFWLAFSEMMRVLRPGGLMFLIVPSAGPIHRYPVDCYRFYPDSLAALAKYAKCHLIECWMDDRGPWKDLVGVFSLEHRPKSTRGRHSNAGEDLSYEGGSTEEEVIGGRDGRLETLANIHQALAPSSYLEIGVRSGKSLRLAQCPAVGVDPAAAVRDELPSSTRLYPCTSDDFFEYDADIFRQNAPDLVLIDGKHLFEFALRDFMNAERIAAPHGLVVIDDIFPNHPRQARRTRETKVWTGDVWKLHAILRNYRPDLHLLPIDTAPTGLLLVAGLDQKNRTLWDRYNSIVKAYGKLDMPPREILQREGAVESDRPEVRSLLDTLKRALTRGWTHQKIARRLRGLRRQS